MKYKTIIEIVTDAENKNEATEIVGEYLSGNIVSGVRMRCSTRPHASIKKAIVTVVALSLLVVVGGLLSVAQIKNSQGLPGTTPGASAIQPTLKTSAQEKDDLDFKKKWESRQTETALDIIKQ